VNIAAILPGLVSLTLSDPRSGEVKRVVVRPVELKGARRYQFESRRGTKALHRNLDAAAAEREIVALLELFRQAHIATTDRDLHVVGGRIVERAASRRPSDGAHDRKKRYLVVDGTPVPFLVRLGVMNRDGRVLAAKQSKFRQVNRFLEIVDDVAEELPKGARVVDFGCGKSYLTFALHHLLRNLRGLDVEIAGVDLKRDVIEECSRLAEGSAGLRFEVGDIAGFRGGAEMVVALHACDTATDDAIDRALEWGAKVILVAPCCQHELRGRLRATPLLKHGLVRERVASLVTDAARAMRLEAEGYDVQVVEFIETEHTPKNLLIRAVKKGRPDAAKRRELAAFLAEWGVTSSRTAPRA
jgi:SAM-dependent methyltransferase